MNIRTSGTLAREDLQRLSITQTHEGQGEADINMDLDVGPTGGFGDLTGEMPEHLAVEGDASLSAPSLRKLSYETMKHIARAFDPLNSNNIYRYFHMRQKPKWACTSRMPLKPRILCAQWLTKSKTFRAKMLLASRCLAPQSC